MYVRTMHDLPNCTMEGHFDISLKVCKPWKAPHEVISYRLISMLSVLSRFFDKLLLKRLMSIIHTKNLTSYHQFGFRNKDTIR